MNTSPFAYVANNPISAYDGDGRKIIYVNGFYSRLLNLMGFAPGSGKESYWNHFSSSFIPSSRSFIGAANNELNEFVNGSSVVGFDQSGQNRYSLGMQYALDNYNELRKGMATGESFKFVSHSEGGAFAAGMAAYLISRGETVESMLYLSPDEADEFSSPIGTFTMQAHFQNDKVSPSMRLDGVDVFMDFKTLNGKEVGWKGAHGSTVTKAAVNKMKDVLGKLGPYVNKLMIKGSWSVTETKDGYKFKREDEENDEQ